MTRQKIVLVLFVVLGLIVLYDRSEWFFQRSTKNQTISVERLKYAFENKKSNLQVGGKGVVKTVLKDDNKGSRHQRFILTLPTNHTILISHNIDLAPRIVNLRKGDTVGFFGEYEWNKKGGIVHWTHHDPQKKHADGWLEHNGRVYQ